jgi:hypothetical protein
MVAVLRRQVRGSSVGARSWSRPAVIGARSRWVGRNGGLPTTVNNSRQIMCQLVDVDLVRPRKGAQSTDGPHDRTATRTQSIALTGFPEPHQGVAERADRRSDSRAYTTTQSIALDLDPPVAGRRTGVPEAGRAWTAATCAMVREYEYAA